MKLRHLSVALVLLAVSSMGLGAQEITWMNYAQPQEKVIFDKLIAKFEAGHPGVKIKFVSVTMGEFALKIQAAMAAKNLPDVFYVGPENIRTYVDNKQLLDLTPYLDKFSKKKGGVDPTDLYANALNRYRYDGKIYGQGPIWALPKDLGPFAFGYNKTIFKKMGIPLPDKDKPYTFDEWIKICQQVTKDTNGDGKLDQWGTGLNVRWSLAQFVWGSGADFIDGTQTKVTITDPKFTAALQFFADQTLKYKITPSSGEAQTLDTYQRWLKGQLAFFPIAPWDLAAFKTLPFEYDLLPWPVAKQGMKSATWVGSVGYGIPVYCKHPEIAAEFALFLSADKDAMKTMTELDLQVPNLKSLASLYTGKPGKPENREEYIQIIEDYGRAWPGEKTYNALWFDEFWVTIGQVLEGKISAKDWAVKVEPKMQKLLDRSIAQAKRVQGK